MYGDAKRNRAINREYLEKIPEALSVGEYEFEMKERKERKKNIMIRGIRAIGKGRKGGKGGDQKVFRGRCIY